MSSRPDTADLCRQARALEEQARAQLGVAEAEVVDAGTPGTAGTESERVRYLRGLQQLAAGSPGPRGLLAQAEALYWQVALANRSLARRWVGADEDAMSEATLALFHAARLFEPDRGWRFATYACSWIRVRVQRSSAAQRSLVRLTAVANEQRRRLQTTVRTWELEGRTWTKAELAAEAQVPPDQVDHLLAGTQVVSTESSLHGETELTVGDRLEAPEALEAFDGADLRLMVDEVNEVLEQLDLPARHKAIYRHYHGLDGENNATLRSIGEVHGVSRERIRQIVSDVHGPLARRLRGLTRPPSPPAAPAAAPKPVATAATPSPPTPPRSTPMPKSIDPKVAALLATLNDPTKSDRQALRSAREAGYDFSGKGAVDRLRLALHRDGHKVPNLLVVDQDTPTGTCRIRGCTADAAARGLCLAHRDRAATAGVMDEVALPTGTGRRPRQAAAATPAVQPGASEVARLREEHAGLAAQAVELAEILGAGDNEDLIAAATRAVQRADGASRAAHLANRSLMRVQEQLQQVLTTVLGADRATAAVADREDLVDSVIDTVRAALGMLLDDARRAPQAGTRVQADHLDRLHGLLDGMERQLTLHGGTEANVRRACMLLGEAKGLLPVPAKAPNEVAA